MQSALTPIITIKDVINTLFDKQNAEAFSITFISLDIERNKGGDIIKLDNAQVPKSQAVKSNLSDMGIGFKLQNKRNPNHIENNTINLTIPGGNKIVKVHIDLITEFKGKRVIW